MQHEQEAQMPPADRFDVARDRGGANRSADCSIVEQHLALSAS
jgi:hypothetical protein